MSQSIATIGGTSLSDFCVALLDRFGEKAFHYPEVLATEFSRFFGLPDIIRLHHLEQLATSY